MNIKSFIFSLFIVVSTFSFAQQGCENTDFSYGNFDFWTGQTGYCCGAGINNVGIVANRHTIITSKYPDPNTNDSIMSMPPAGGGAYSVRLGNDNTGSESESLSKSFTVNNGNKFFIYQYALVLEDPDGHSPIEKPKFEVKIIDQAGNIVKPEECGYYQVTAGAQTNDWGVYGGVRYKDWTTVGLDLSAYLGQKVTVVFTTEDCGLGGHYGYAYIDAACGFLDIDVIGFCKNSNTVQLKAPPGFKTYYWPINGSHASSITIPKPNVGDSVIVEVTNEAGCTSKILHVFEELPVVKAIAWKDSTICAGVNVPIFADGGGVNGKYKWYANNQVIDSVQNTIVTPLHNTTYKVIVANANGCYSKDSVATVTINVDSTLVFQLPNDTTICNASTITIHGPIKNGVTYKWSDSDGNTYPATDQIQVSPAATTTYYLTIQNNTCSFTDSMKIKVMNGSNYYPDTIPTNYCTYSTQLVLKSPDYFSTYNWSNNVTTFRDTINPQLFSTIQLKFTDINGCPDSTVYKLIGESTPIPYISIPNDTMCLSQGTTLSVSSPANTNCYYTWYPVDSSYTNTGDYFYVNPTITTSYIVKATSFAGCSTAASFDTITIHVDSSAYFTINPSMFTICKGQNTSFGVANNLTGTFDWTLNGSIISHAKQITASPLTSSYYYITRNYKKCSFTQSVYVNVNPVYSTTQIVDVCATSSSVNLSIPTGYSAYYWPTFNNSNNSNVHANPTNNQLIPVYCTKANTCVDTTVYKINIVQPSHLLPMTNDTVCKGDVAVINVQSTGTNDLYHWTASPGNKTFSGSTIYDSPQVNTTYSVTLSNALNCITAPISGQVLYTVSTPITANIPASISICPGDSIVLFNQNNGGKISWDFNGQTFLDDTLKTYPSYSGIATITIQNDACVRTGSTNVNIYPVSNYIITANPGTTICTGTQLDLSVFPNNGVTYDWYVNNVFNVTASTLTKTPTATTTYSVTIHDNNNCVSSTSQQIIVYQTPTVSLGEDFSLCQGSSQSLTAVTNVSSATYNWTTNELTPSIVINQPGTYGVIVTNGICSASDQVNVGLTIPSFIGEIPNVITSNSDLVNDELKIVNSNLIAYKILIVNRWGEKMFETTDAQKFWNGTDLHGNKVPEGVYYYTINYTENCSAQADHEVTGFVTVIK